MKLLIFPGEGNPDSQFYAKVYGLLTDRAKDLGYSTVDASIRWPGHVCNSYTAGDVLRFEKAMAVAITKLTETEQEGEPYVILARSFGTYVAIKAVASINTVYLQRIVLWGTSPFWVLWELFVRDLASYKSAASKGLLIDENLFPYLEPIESLLPKTAQKVIVASGTEDKYSTPAFHAYLEQIVAGARGDIFSPSRQRSSPRGLR